MSKIFIVLASFCVGLSVLAGGAYGTPSNKSPQDTINSAPKPANTVVQWNRALLVIVRTPKAQPATIHPTRSFAIMHAAIYDAVNAIEGTHKPYLVRLTRTSRFASQDAAADAAAHAVLVALYPNFQTTLDAELQQLLAQIPDGADKAEGISIGGTVAERILALRSNDGSASAQSPFVFGAAPGDYQSTPPNFPAQPQFTHWSHVIPFALERASQFRPEPPPALASDTYSDVLNEVQSLGVTGSTTATSDEALTGRFWNGAIQNYWNEIAQTAGVAQNLTTAQNARLFALLNVTFADDVIAFYDAKYTYNFWRPVTAIREDGTDGNPKTLPDPNWLPEVGNTTPDPSYPGAHAVISASGASVLSSFFGRNHFDFNVTSEVLPGPNRSFSSFSAAAEEATLSRIFAGVHFRSDLTTGQHLGRQIADLVVDNFFTPVHGRDDSDGDR
jgi:membrane-associated phospholipid phosphatase